MALLFDEREELGLSQSRRSSQESITSYDSSQSSNYDVPGLSYLPLVDYALTVQHDPNFQSYHNDIYCWLLSNSIILESPRCVVYRAVNYLDRFLSVMKVSSQYLEGISWICYFLAESVGDNRGVSFSYHKVCEYFKDTFNLEVNEVTSIMQCVLKVLGFRLLCPCPYTMCYRALEACGHLDLCNNAFILMDSICARYSSIAFNENTKMIAVLTALSSFVFGNPNTLLPAEYKDNHICHSGVSFCLEMIYESFPEMNPLNTIISK